MSDFRCEACNGTGLASVAEQVHEEHERQRSHDEAADSRWRQAAEAVLGSVKVQGEPALDFIAKAVALGERISA